jgi:hypothetical protein
MRAVWESGYRSTMLQMHDCLDCSVSSKEQAEAIARLGEECVKLTVQMLVDRNYGRTWGDAKHSWEELHGLPAVEDHRPATIERWGGTGPDPAMEPNLGGARPQKFSEPVEDADSPDDFERSAAPRRKRRRRGQPRPRRHQRRRPRRARPPASPSW